MKIQLKPQEKARISTRSLAPSAVLVRFCAVADDIAAPIAEAARYRPNAQVARDGGQVAGLRFCAGSRLPRTSMPQRHVVVLRHDSRCVSKPAILRGFPAFRPASEVGIPAWIP